MQGNHVGPIFGTVDDLGGGQLQPQIIDILAYGQGDFNQRTLGGGAFKLVVAGAASHDDFAA